MRYEDYKIEDMVFTTKENWTEEEMKEWLDTCPDSNKIQDIRAALVQFKKDVENEVIKKNKWNDWNQSSLKAYSKKHAYIYCSTDSWRQNTAYVTIDGNEKYMRRISDIDDVIAEIDKNDIKKRFENVIKRYVKKEETNKEWLENNAYKIKHKDRIIAGKKVVAYLRDFKIQYVSKLHTSGWESNGIPLFYTERTDFNGWDFTHQSYFEEWKLSDIPVSKDDCEKIIEVIKEANRKISLIKKRVEIEIEEMEEKYRDLKKNMKEE